MTDRHYNSEEGEFVDFETLADWERRDKEQRRRISELREALRAGENLIAGDLTGAEWKRACCEFLTTARAAIAKAEGRS